MKNLQNLNGVTRLSSAQQKETFGGIRPIKIKCNSSCAGRLCHGKQMRMGLNFY